MFLKTVNKFVKTASPEILSAFLKNTPAGMIKWKRNTSFRDTVRYAYKYSPFYRKKFDGLGIDISKVKEPADLGDFYTTPADIIENAEEFLCRKPQIVFESSGTTGRNKRIYLTHDELDQIGRMMAAGLFLGGMDRNDRLVNAFDFNIWIPGIITHKCLEKSGLFGMDTGKVDPMEVYERIPVYGFNVVMGEPTWLIKLTEIAEKKGSYPLKLIIGGAEEMPEAARPWMKEVWQGAEVRMVYASVESAGVIAYEPFAGCKGYHINENSFLLETIDPDGDGYGEIAFTTLDRLTMPLVRYRNRDVGKLLGEKCPCGLPFRLLSKLRGRKDELIVAAGGNLYPLMFDKILKDIEGITNDWQIIFMLRGIKEVMQINLEIKDPSIRERVEKHVLENIRDRYPDLWKNMSLDIFNTEFAWHPPSAIRTGIKLLRIVDKRYA